MEVCKLLELDESEYEEKIADFFESLTTSKEFILLSDGNWDLRINHSVKIDMDDIYEESDSEEEEISEDDTDLSDEDNYDDDIPEDDFSDLTIVDENELDDEN